MRRFLILVAAYLAAILWPGPGPVGEVHAQSFLAFTVANQVTTSISKSRAANGTSDICPPPCYVQFDLSGSNSTLTSNPFHELDYTCTFGDATAGAWAYGTRTAADSKNTGYGPVQAHVFGTAGTHNVSCTARHGTTTHTAQTTVVVTAADTQWAGAATLCVRQTAGGSFVGCPAGATQVTDADFDNVITTTAGKGATHKRILFECDGTYTSSTPALIDVDGPGYIGAYPIGCAARAKPIISGNTGIVVRWGNNTNLGDGTCDWRVEGLDWNGVDSTGRAHMNFPNGAQGGPVCQVTFHQNTFRNYAVAIEMLSGSLDTINASSAAANLPSQFGFVANEFTTLNANSVLGAWTKVAFMGNRMQLMSTEHAIRLQYTDKAVISNNELYGTATGVGAGGAALQVRAVCWTNRAACAGNENTFTIPLNSYTQYVSIIENRMFDGDSTTSQGSPVGIRPVNSGEDARIRHVVFDGNWITNSHAFVGVFSTATDSTFRNNLIEFDLLSTNVEYAFQLDDLGGVDTTNVYVYHNSVYTPDAFADAANIVNIDATNTTATVTVRNNLGVTPANTNATGTCVTPPGDGTCPVNNVGTVTASNNSTRAQMQGASPLSTTPPTTTAHWRPAAASYPIDAGTSVPVWRDFFQALRSGTYDLGAVNP